MMNSSLAEQAYDLVNSKAQSNSFIHGFSGILGFITTIAADVATIPAIYGKMWDEVRAVYGHKPVGSEAAKTVLMQVMPEVLSDIAFDKILGNVPIVGIYFNAICAKQMAWRLGTLFAFMSARGSEIPSDKVAEAMVLIRHMFPQKDMFAFTTPNKHNFIKLVESVEGNSIQQFEKKVSNALELLSKN